MNEQVFLQTINEKAKDYGINPLLLISGMEGIYTFRNVEVNEINYEFLDSLILTIFALRIGDRFHSIAEKNLSSNNYQIMQAAAHELKPLSYEEIAHSDNPYLQSFARLVAGKSVVRQYHQKALEAAAVEVKNAQMVFSNESIGSIMLQLCKNDLQSSLDLDSFFGQ
ncbi:hypothetical protein OCK74_16575 [Chitinophagaceae bacterium LB-8]|uniref:Uncharacterized protein n=1 Tax=Paraflavisolibacter caeni TaxID=2982496 RepID=A0A9X2XXF7_9BACT|nr:hypothetical protein [Paraflavisolibacter caeni]MCU7550735.1 hypothetical protein [Paraflavisolibacter caeni]